MQDGSIMYSIRVVRSLITKAHITNPHVQTQIAWLELRPPIGVRHPPMADPATNQAAVTSAMTKITASSKHTCLLAPLSVASHCSSGVLAATSKHSLRRHIIVATIRPQHRTVRRIGLNRQALASS
jgi:hypothetical protein